MCVGIMTAQFLCVSLCSLLNPSLFLSLNIFLLSCSTSFKELSVVCSLCVLSRLMFLSEMTFLLFLIFFWSSITSILSFFLILICVIISYLISPSISRLYFFFPCLKYLVIFLLFLWAYLSRRWSFSTGILFSI